MAPIPYQAIGPRCKVVASFEHLERPCLITAATVYRATHGAGHADESYDGVGYHMALRTQRVVYLHATGRWDK